LTGKKGKEEGEEEEEEESVFCHLFNSILIGLFKIVR